MFSAIEQSHQETPNGLLQSYQYDLAFEEAIGQNPSQLTLMLMEAAVIKAETAKLAHDQQRWTEKGFHLGRLTAIIDGTRDRLDRRMDAQLIHHFDTLYAYIDHCVQSAVTEAGDEFLNLAMVMLTEIRDAWRLAIDAKKPLAA